MGSEADNTGTTSSRIICNSSAGSGNAMLASEDLLAVAHLASCSPKACSRKACRYVFLEPLEPTVICLDIYAPRTALSGTKKTSRGRHRGLVQQCSPLLQRSSVRTPRDAPGAGRRSQVITLTASLSYCHCSE